MYHYNTKSIITFKLKQKSFADLFYVISILHFT